MCRSEIVVGFDLAYPVLRQRFLVDLYVSRKLVELALDIVKKERRLYILQRLIRAGAVVEEEEIRIFGFCVGAGVKLVFLDYMQAVRKLELAHLADLHLAERLVYLLKVLVVAER